MATNTNTNAKNANEPEENTSGFNLGDLLSAPAYGNLEHDIKGEVEKIYEHSLLIVITENDPVDQSLVDEMNHRAVVPMVSVKVIKKAKRKKRAKKTEEK